MNGLIHQAIWRCDRLLKHFLNIKSVLSWEHYHTQWNLVVKLIRRAKTEHHGQKFGTASGMNCGFRNRFQKTMRCVVHTKVRFKMAMARQVKHSKGFYCDLNEQSSSIYYKNSKRCSGGKMYEIERIVLSKTVRGKVIYTTLIVFFFIEIFYIFTLPVYCLFLTAN